MKPEQKHIDKIRTDFREMQTKEHLLQLFNYAKPLIYGEKTIPFSLKQLTWHANPRLSSKKNYKKFKIKKKSGEFRSIHAPAKGLKALQKTLSYILQCVFEPHQAAMGFVIGKSIVDNAKRHEGSKYVYNIDLKDFFPSIDQARVWKCLQLKPFLLTDSEAMPDDKNSKKVQTGIRQFITDHGERIFYRLEGNSIMLVGDKKGNFKKYEKRVTGHLVRPSHSLFPKDKEGREKIIEYNRQIEDALFEDAKRYILFQDNIQSLTRLIPSRRNLANMIAAICCTEMEVERKNEAGEWEKRKCNVLPQGAPTSPIITNIVCQRLDHLLSGVARRFGLKYSRYADDITFSSMHNVYQPGSEFIQELHRIIAEQGFHIKESKTRLQKDGHRKEVTGLLVNEKVNVQQRYIKQLRMWLYYWERYGYEKAYAFFLQQYLSGKSNGVKGKPDMANVISGKLDYLKMVKGNDNMLYQNLRERMDKLTGDVDPINKILDIWESEGIESAIDLYYSKKSNSKHPIINDSDPNLKGSDIWIGKL